MGRGRSSGEGAAAPVVLLARQPVLTPEGRIDGYELLFRSPEGRSAAEAQPEQATAQVLVAALSDAHLAALTGGVPAWVNMSRELLLMFDPLPLARGAIVVELLEHAALDDLLVRRLVRLGDEGHPLALDDFVPRPEAVRVLTLASFVKLDLVALGRDAFAAALGALRRPGLRVVAEKVETHDERDWAVGQGVDLLQGWFFERPRPIALRPVPMGALGRLRSALALQGDATFEEVERAIIADAGLSIRVLRLANSAAVAGRHRVASVREALVRLGSRTVAQWALLVVLSELGQDRPALLGAGLLRARQGETLARERGAADPDAWFTAGLLSIADALLDAPLAQVVASLPLTDELGGALIHHSGSIGSALELAIRLERGEAAPADHELVPAAAAITWSEELLAELQS